MATTCTTCKVTLNSPFQYQQHLSGKQHAKKLRLQTQGINPQSSTAPKSKAKKKGVINFVRANADGGLLTASDQTHLETTATEVQSTDTAKPSNTATAEVKSSDLSQLYNTAAGQQSTDLSQFYNSLQMSDPSQFYATTAMQSYDPSQLYSNAAYSQYLYNAMFGQSYEAMFGQSYDEAMFGQSYDEAMFGQSYDASGDTTANDPQTFSPDMFMDNELQQEWYNWYYQMANAAKRKKVAGAGNVTMPADPSVFADNMGVASVEWGSFECLYCSICAAQLPGKEQAELHYKGQKHMKKAKIARLRELGALEGYVDINEAGNAASSAASLKKGGYFFCSFCNITVNSDEQLTIHMTGSRHKKMMEMRKRHMEIMEVVIPVKLPLKDEPSDDGAVASQ